MGYGVPCLGVPVRLLLVFVGLAVENVLAVQAAEIATLVALGLCFRLAAVVADSWQLAGATQHGCCFGGRSLAMCYLMGQALQMWPVQGVESAWVLVTQPIEFIRVGGPNMQRQAGAVAAQTQPRLMADMGLLFTGLAQRVD